MGKFSKKVGTKVKTHNLAGGKAYKETPKVELVGNLLTSFVESQFYRDENEGIEKIKSLIEQEKDKEFVAKAAIFARNEFGMRSITHITAAEIANSVKGEEWTKRFFNQVVRRPDDMAEILAYYLANYDKPIPNSLKKGFRMAFEKFDEYQLGKYKGGKNEVKLVDVINLVHPKHSKAIGKLIKGTLESPETWEVLLTQAGQKAKDEEDKVKRKAKVWKTLIKEEKIGYFALLRNLRNILEQAPTVVEDACDMLTNEKLIKGSLVLPFRFNTAFEQIIGSDKEGAREVVMALNKAVDISLKNVPKLKGKTLVVVDSSGSMEGKPAEIASLFAAMLVKSNNADLMLFSDDARYINVNPMDSTLTIKKTIPFMSGGTNFHSIFQTAKKAYDRIVILSDMQGWMGYETPLADFNKYKKEYDCDPLIYSWNLSDQDGTIQFPQNKIFAISGWSEKVFDIIKLLEEDKDAMLTKIEDIEF